MTSADLEYAMKEVERKHSQGPFSFSKLKPGETEMQDELKRLGASKVTDICDRLIVGLQRIPPNGAINHEVGSTRAGLRYLKASYSQPNSGRSPDESINELYAREEDTCRQLIVYSLKLKLLGS